MSNKNLELQQSEVPLKRGKGIYERKPRRPKVVDTSIVKKPRGRPYKSEENKIKREMKKNRTEKSKIGRPKGGEKNLTYRKTLITMKKHQKDNLKTLCRSLNITFNKFVRDPINFYCEKHLEDFRKHKEQN